MSPRPSPRRRRGSAPSARGRRSSCSSGVGRPRERPAARRSLARRPSGSCPSARNSERDGPRRGAGIGHADEVHIGLGDVDPTILLLIVPLAIVQLTLLILAVVDLLRDDRRVRGGNKGVWAVIIVFVNLIGPILYFLVGRDDRPVDVEPGPGAVPGWGSPHDPPIVAGPHAGERRQTGGEGGASERDEEAPVLAAAPAVVAPRRTGGVTTDAPSAIRVDGLTKRYPGGVLALDRLSLDVPGGSVFGLLGPNGAGKTTCLRLLAGLTRPTDGRA